MGLPEVLPLDTTRHFIGGTHTRRFADNLLPSFSAEHVQTLREQLARGAGDERSATASEKYRAHRPILVGGACGERVRSWLGAEHQRRIAGLGWVETQISLEHKLRIAHDGGVANLDCPLVAVELAEQLEHVEERERLHHPESQPASEHARERCFAVIGRDGRSHQSEGRRSAACRRTFLLASRGWR